MNLKIFLESFKVFGRKMCRKNSVCEPLYLLGTGNKTLSTSFESEIANPKMQKGHKSVMADEKKIAIESKMCDYDINKCQHGCRTV